MSKDINYFITTSVQNNKNTNQSSEKVGSLNNSSNPPKSLQKKKRKTANSLLWLEDVYNIAQGETALWVAVITQAMMDALSNCKKSESLYQKHDATCWLTSNSKDFIDVCLSAEMNPDYVRRKAKQALSSPSPWRAEAGQGKRYQERKKYREKQKLEAKKNKEKEATQAEIIFLNLAPK
jgi:hypothetical protein